MIPRQYQIEDGNAITECYNRGDRRLLGVQATGLGKSYFIANLDNLVPIKGKTLVIVNREELVFQVKQHIENCNPGICVGIEKAEYRHSPWIDDCVVASIQTIGSVKTLDDGSPDFNARLKSFNPDDFTRIAVDESHHITSESYRTVLKFFRVYKNDPKYNDPNKLLLGLTATPNRSDNKGLEEMFSTVAFNRDIRWGIKNGWLVDIEAYRAYTSVSLEGVKITAGDFNAKHLSNKINTSERNKIVVDKYIEVCSGKKAIAFCSTVEHSIALAKMFNENGIAAFSLDAKTPADIRRRVLREDFKKGTIKVLTSVGVLTEGFDDPSVEVVLMVRPTKSGLLYRQAIGRGLRPYPAPEEVAAIRAEGREPDWIKPACIVIDYVDVSSRHSLITAPTLFGLSPNLDLKGKKAVETVEELEEKLKKLSAAKQATTNLSLFDDLTKLQAHMERVDLLSVPSTPDEIKAVSELSWISSGSSYQLSLPDNTFSIKQNTLGGFDCHKITKGLLQFLDSYPSLDKAISAVEGRLPDNEYSFAKANQKWRKDPPNEGQIKLLCMLDLEGVRRHNGRENYSANVRETLTKGQVSQMISKLPKPRWWKEQR